MKISKPTAILAGLSTISLGGVIGTLLTGVGSNTPSSDRWETAIGIMVANLLFQLYREYRSRRWAREDKQAKAELEQRVTQNMKTRLSDLSRRLDSIVTDATASEMRRRAEDIERDRPHD